ncbi:MAG: purine-nucleoside phosphorylase [Verrucomicrobiota bacterium]
MSDIALDRLRDWGADLAIVLGSGLNALVTEAAPENRIPYADFAGLPKTSVPGHAGQFILGCVNEMRVIYAQGRVHLYEGHSAEDVAAGVRLLGETGIKRLILTNAAGCANENFSPGSWMIISDHLNLTGTSPLIGRADFIDMTDSYSSKWRAKFRSAAKSEGLTLHEGIYAGLLGPQYETPAEVRMLRSLGADAIGMSTVIEAIQARALGLEVAGFSCLTNWAAGMGGAPLSHEDVLETGRNAAEMFARLLNAALAAA